MNPYLIVVVHENGLGISHQNHTLGSFNQYTIELYTNFSD